MDPQVVEAEVSAATGVLGMAQGCGFPSSCGLLDLTETEQFARGAYSNAADCVMRALRQGRPGVVTIRTARERFQVFTATDGSRWATRQARESDPDVDSEEGAASTGVALGEPERCDVDAGLLAACSTPEWACLRPENWVDGCNADAPLACPDDVPVGGDCQPSAGAPRWLTEGDSLDYGLFVTCSDGTPVPPGAITFDELPRGATYDRFTGRFRWQPGLDQAAVHDLVFRMRGTGEPGVLRVGVADAFDDPDNQPIVDPARYSLEYGLPVFFLEDPEHNTYESREVIYAGKRYRGAYVKTRGRTSLAYPKHSYTLKLDGGDLFSEPAHGLTDRKKVVLISTFDDNTYLRQRLAHEMWGLLDPEHLAVRAYSAVVYRDGEYRGLYTVTDHIDRHLMRHHQLSGGGELFKSVTHDGDFLTPAHGMEKAEGTPYEGEPGWDASLRSVVDFVREVDDQEFGDRLHEHIDVRDYQHWWVFVMFTAAVDSTGKNAYHYRDSPQSVFRAIPWDFNASFGQRWNTYRAGSPGNLLGRNGIWARMARDPAMRDELRDRLLAALRGPYRRDLILARFERYRQEIKQGVRRDWIRWANEHRKFRRWRDRNDFLEPEEEAEYLRSWIEAHWDYLENNVDTLLGPNPER